MAQLSTKELQTRAQDALAASPVHALRELVVQGSAGSLVLSGLVTSFYHKQLAQEVVLAVADGFEVVNSIRVAEQRSEPKPHRNVPVRRGHLA